MSFWANPRRVIEDDMTLRETERRERTSSADHAYDDNLIYTVREWAAIDLLAHRSTHPCRT